MSRSSPGLLKSKGMFYTATERPYHLTKTRDTSAFRLLFQDIPVLVALTHFTASIHPSLPCPFLSPSVSRLSLPLLLQGTSNPPSLSPITSSPPHSFPAPSLSEFRSLPSACVLIHLLVVEYGGVSLKQDRCIKRHGSVQRRSWGRRDD